MRLILSSEWGESLEGLENMERLQMCKGRSDDDFEDGDDERGFRNICWCLLAFYDDTLAQGWHVMCVSPRWVDASALVLMLQYG